MKRISKKLHSATVTSPDIVIDIFFFFLFFLNGTQPHLVQCHLGFLLEDNTSPCQTQLKLNICLLKSVPTGSPVQYPGKEDEHTAELTLKFT